MKRDLNNSIDFLISEYSQLVFSIAMMHTKNRSDADDVFQNVFLACYQKNISFESEEHQKAWLIKTTLNQSKKINNSIWKKRTTELDENLTSQSSVFSTLDQQLVFDALCNIKEKYRIVLHLFYFEQLSILEITKILNRSESAIKVQLSRGRAMLKELLKGDFEDE